MLQADVREHLERVEHDQADALVFSSPAGTPMPAAYSRRGPTRGTISAVAIDVMLCMPDPDRLPSL